MKTRLYALLASAALIAQAQAGPHQGGGGSFAAPGRGGGFARGGAPSFHPAPFAHFGGGRMVYSGQRFSTPTFRSPYISSNGRAFAGMRQFNSANINRGAANPRTVANGRGQIRNGNNLPANWRNHVVAQHSANWHRDWDRHHDHFFHGHRFVFIDGFWWGFDPWWPYSYPYDYYAGDYYPYPYGYGYDYGAYQGDGYYDQNGYADQNSDSTVAAAQDRLAQQGYYRGAIDGVLGPETRRAIAQYQSNHGLGATGALTTDTLRALGLSRVASY